MNNLETMSDEELALSYIDGNNSAFDILLQRNESKVFSYILFVVHDKEKANDIFQETFVKVIVKLRQGKYTSNGKFSAWVLRIARNIMLDGFREQKRGNVVEARQDNDLSNFGCEMLDGNIENKYINDQVLLDVKKMMNLLPDTQREVVFMRFYQDMSFKEIAEVTNVSINTALGRMRYAILNLRRMAKTHDIALQLD
jgi:RNA polymerase sigma factor (sigma-70 family)